MLNDRYYTRRITLRNVMRQERKNVNKSAQDTRGIERSSDFVQPAAITCEQRAFIPQYNDRIVTLGYFSAATVAKSPCITMGFCNANRYTSELSGVPFQVGERL